MPGAVITVERSWADARPSVCEARGTGVDLQVRLLDGFDLSCGGKPVPLPHSAQRLVAFLALRDRPVLRQYVAGNLWLEKSDDRAAANLRCSLWRVRQTGLDIVQTPGLHLCLSSLLRVDVRDAIADARDIVEGSTDLPAAATTSLLAGDLLPDWYDDWVIIERERIRQLRLHALEALSSHLLERARPAEAIEAALAAVAAEPLRESAHRVLIAAHLAEGNACEALRQYETFAGLLRESLGISPSSRLSELIAPVQAGS